MNLTDRPDELPKLLKNYLKKTFLNLQDCHFLLAYSGGPDSTALFLLLAELRQTLGFQFTALWVDHGMRSVEERLTEEQIVRKNCDTWKVPLIVRTLTAHERKSHGFLGQEGMARKLRIHYLKEALVKGNFSCIFTAHNLEDQVETILMRLLKGNSYLGLGGIPPQNGHFYRPLLSVSKTTLIQFLDQRQCPYSVDSTNTTDLYERNRLRNQLLPVLDRLYPQWKRALSGWGTEEREFLTQEKKRAEEYFHRENGPAPIPITLWAQWSRVSRIHWLGLVLNYRGQLRQPRGWFLQAIHNLETRGWTDAPGGGQFKKQLFFVVFDPAVVNFPYIGYFIAVERDKPISLMDKTLVFSLQGEDSCSPIGTSGEKLFIISKSWGDGLDFPQGRTRLTKLLRAWGVPADRRGLIPLLVEGSQIRGVLGSVTGYSDWFRPFSKGDSAVYLKMR